VPEPAKKSRIILSSCVLDIFDRYLIKPTGLGKSKGIFNSSNSFALCRFSYSVIKSFGS
jgi:hypothetical protein